VDTRSLRAPSPALVISLIALFVALGGTAYASGLIPGSQIKNHSIPARKLTRSAIKSLHGHRGTIGPQGPKGPQGLKGDTGPQGPGAISILRGNVPDDGTDHLLTTVGGIDVDYACANTAVYLFLFPHSSGDTEYLSGDYATNGTLKSVQTSTSTSFPVSATTTANLDVIAWAGSVGTLSRFDLGGYDSGTACNIWGLITPSGS
jgi:hypothetical protein